MDDFFQFAAGSVGGRSHQRAGKNNQDAYCCLCEQDRAVAIVCDGCGSGKHSEVGAQIGAHLIAGVLLRESRRRDSEITSREALEPLLDQVRCHVLARLRLLATEMSQTGIGESWLWTISNYFLFTVVGTLITPSGAAFFSLGDGVQVVNEEVTVLGPFPGNAPPYLAYGLLENGIIESGPTTGSRHLCLQINRIVPHGELCSFLIGTDGVQDLIQTRDNNLPGKSECVGPLSQFWQQDRYFANHDMVRRRLAGLARDVVTCTEHGIRKEPGLLSDDTTLIVGRHRLLNEGDVPMNMPVEVTDEKR